MTNPYLAETISAIAWQKGFVASRSGIPQSRNPYERVAPDFATPPGRVAWLEGWLVSEESK